MDSVTAQNEQEAADLKAARLLLDLLQCRKEGRTADISLLDGAPPEWRDLAKRMLAGDREKSPVEAIREGVSQSLHAERLDMALQRAMEELRERDQAVIESLGSQQSRSEEPPGGCTLADVASIVEKVEWLWPEWVPLGFVTLLAGRPGIGKSLLALQGLAAPVLDPDRFTFPDGSQCQIREGWNQEVIWVDTEYSQAMLVERAENLQLDLGRIRIPPNPSIPGDKLAMIRLDEEAHLESLRKLVRATGAPLVIVDAFLGAHHGNESKSHVVAKVLMGLAEIARDENIAIVVVDHLRKAREGENGNIVDVERIRDSSAKAQFARSVIVLDAPDDHQQELVRVRVVKSNLCKGPDAVGMQIEDPGVAKWLDDPPGDAVPQSRVDEAGTFLRKELSNGEVPVMEIRQRAREEGHSWTTVERAKKAHGIRSRKIEGGRWAWSLAD